MGSFRHFAWLLCCAGIILALMAACSRTPTGRPESPWVVFDDDSLSFGRIRVGQDTTFIVPVTFNHVPRDRPLSFVATDARFHLSPTSWDPSERLPSELNVHFYPTLADSYAAWIQVLSAEEVVGEVHTEVIVWSPWASLRVESGKIDFGVLPPESVTSRGLRVENSPLSSMPCTLEIAQPSHEVNVVPLSGVLAPGESLEFRLQLVCNGEESRREDLEILSNDPFQRSIRVELSGECMGTPRIEGLPASLDFKKTAELVGKTRSFTVANRGDGTLIMDASAIPPDFKVQPERLVIPPGDSQVLQVDWVPTNTGIIAESIVWEANLAAEVVLPVVGEAIPGIVPSESLGGILLEMTPLMVREEFGSADWTLCEPGCAVSWNYDVEDAVLFSGKEDSCCVADVSGEAREIAGWNTFPGRTRNGTGVRSSIAEVVSEFGATDIISEEGPTLWYAYPEDGILFMFVQNRVYLVDVFRPEDWAGGFETLFESGGEASLGSSLLSRHLDRLGVDSRSPR